MEKHTLQVQLEQAMKDRNKIDDEVKRLKKEIVGGNIPKTILVGQIYKVPDATLMVAALGPGIIGLTSVGVFPGCYSFAVLSGVYSKEGIREALIEKKATYLGHFFSVFTRRENKNG